MAEPRAITITENCPACGGKLRIQRRRTDREPFIGCSSFPKCRFTEPYFERNQRMIERIEELQLSLNALRAELQAQKPAAPDTTAIKQKLTDLVFEFHPDRNQGGLDANTVVKALIAVRRSI